MKSFYYVYSPGTRGPSVKHDTFAEAVTESERLAAKEPEKPFYVLKALAVSQVQKPVSTFYMDGVPSPFTRERDDDFWDHVR